MNIVLCICKYGRMYGHKGYVCESDGCNEMCMYNSTLLVLMYMYKGLLYLSQQIFIFK